MSHKFPKRTKRQSLLRMKKLWKTIIKYKLKNKQEAYRILNWSIKSDKKYCPACTYHQTHSINTCPLHTHPSKPCIIPWLTTNCHSIKYSPYNKWFNTGKPKYAKQIVNLINKAIKAL